MVSEVILDTRITLPRTIVDIKMDAPMRALWRRRRRRRRKEEGGGGGKGELLNNEYNNFENKPTKINYCITLIFRRSKFSRIAFFDKKFRKYAVEAGDGAKCQNLR